MIATPVWTRAGIIAGFLVSTSCGPAAPASSVIVLDASRQYQTFKGWETVVLPTVLDYEADLPGFESLFAQMARDLAVTRVRIDVQSGMEGHPGFGARYLSRAMTENELVTQFAYNIVNDNDDPNVANLAAFDFTLLDWQMEHLVVPYRRHLEAAGAPLYVYLTYVDFRESAFEHYDHPEEYAEFMLVLFDHLKTRFDMTPAGIDVMNEPDQTRWTGSKMGRAIASAGARLAAAGYRPEFIAPSTVDRAHAVTFLDDILSIPGAQPYLKELSYHCYRDSGRDSLGAIGRRAAQAGIATTQNECWQPSNDQTALHRDLTLGQASAWQQGTFNGNDGYYKIDRAAGTASLRPRTKLLRQYYKAIRPGAVRIEASTTASALDPVAFVNTDGRHAIVILAESAGTASIQKLPAGTYAVSYSTDVDFDVHAPDVEVRDGQPLIATIPRAGVLTVQAK